MRATRAETNRFDAAVAELYHGVPVRYRTRRVYHRMRFARWLENGRALIVVYRKRGDAWQAYPLIVDASEIVRSSDSFDPPPLPDHLRGPACPDCYAWPLDHHGGKLWFCNSCLKDVRE